jgi:hypothetical protein
MKKLATLAAMALLMAATSGGVAESASKTERVRFKSGASSATINGAIKGYDTASFILGAKAGQVMSVLFSGSLNACYFNLIEPGADSAVHMGEIAGNEYSANLTATGDYRAEVYMMRSEARRGKTCKFQITFEITGAGASNASDAKVPGTDFNATGIMPCARSAGQPMNQCDFGVVRNGDGSGQITIMWPDGGNRVIFFTNNKPSSYDQSEADGGATMSVIDNDGLFSVKIGDQRFEFPEAVMVGG